MKTSLVRDALSAIYAKTGKLKPGTVVKAAKNPDSPLHECFEWDDSEAAHQHRLWQARQLIVSVRISLDDKAETICQAYVSLKPDRKVEGGGYRSIGDVMGDPALRDELLKTALEELRSFQERYARFKELLPVFDAIAMIGKRKRTAA